jgi:general secretion pathway protein D
MRKLAIGTIACGAAALLVAAAPGSAQAPKRGNEGTFTIQFEDVDIAVFIKFIGKATGRNFVFSEKVTGPVTVVSPVPVTASEAFAVFQSVLAVRGLTMIEDGVVTRIVPLKEARTAGAAVVREGEESAGFATRLFPLTHVHAQEAAAALEPLISKEGSLVAYQATNTLIATDTTSSLNRMAEIVKALDIPSHEESVEIIHLQHADASTLSESITEILGEDRRARDKAEREKPPFRLVPDTRTNSIVVVASAADRRKIAELARGLDSPLDPGEQRINVYYVKHADAGELVDVISGMLTGRRRTTPTPGAPQQAQQAPQAARSSGQSRGLADEVSITADTATNAVIVDASMQDYRTIRALLESLDIPRPQVFVEAIVAEITLQRTEALGFEFQTGGDIGDGTGVARSNLGVLSSLATATGAANPLALGGLILAATSDKTIELPDGTEIPAQSALFNALASDQDIEILSAPTLLTLDNQEARIVVGENVPFITGQATDLANVDNVFTQVDRRDVGIKLTLTPQVAEGDMVILDVQEEVSALVQQTLQADVVTQVGPSYTIRSAETTVSVKDGHTAVIGGLISNSLATRASKIPLLGSIPYIGRLFRSEAGRNDKVNLIVVLTPHIIRSAEDLKGISATEGGRYRKRVDELADFMGDREVPTEIPGAQAPPPGVDSTPAEPPF